MTTMVRAPPSSGASCLAWIDSVAVSVELPEIAGAPSGPRELVEWSSRVRAHVFVAAGQLDSQRDRVIREASELGSMLLGEPLYGATPAQVRARVEAAAA